MKKTRELCNGCHDDFYNGKNPHGVKACWSFERAKIVEHMHVGTRQNPPYKWKPRKGLSCYHPEGGVMITRDDPRVVLEETTTV